MRTAAAVNSRAATPPILVTGAPRSGTSWVGRILGAAPRVATLYEPFNPQRRVGLCTCRFESRYTYITEESGKTYREGIARMLRYGTSYRTAFRQIRAIRGLAGLAKNTFLFAHYRAVQARPLLKDPVAVFSSLWLARSFSMQVVVIVRHPAAFVSSMKLQSAAFDFRVLLSQRLLIADHLREFEQAMRDAADNPDDIVGCAALAWTVIYHTLDTFATLAPEWLFIRHEDLSLQPFPRFAHLFGQLSLPYTERVKKVIERLCFDSDVSDVSRRNPWELRRNSLCNVWQWRERLSALELARVRDICGVVSQRYYGDDEW